MILCRPQTGIFWFLSCRWVKRSTECFKFLPKAKTSMATSTEQGSRPKWSAADAVAYSSILSLVTSWVIPVVSSFSFVTIVTHVNHCSFLQQSCSTILQGNEQSELGWKARELVFPSEAFLWLCLSLCPWLSPGGAQGMLLIRRSSYFVLVSCIPSSMFQAYLKFDGRKISSLSWRSLSKWLSGNLEMFRNSVDLEWLCFALRLSLGLLGVSQEALLGFLQIKGLCGINIVLFLLLR